MPASLTLSLLTPSELLRASQSDGPHSVAAREFLVERFGRLLERLAAQTCRRYHLNEQEQDEVLAETYQQLLNPEIARFRPFDGKPHHYFQGLVQNAARKTLTQVGTRHRNGQGRGAADVRYSDAGEAGRDGVVGGRYLMTSNAPSPGVQAEVRDMVDYVMECAPPKLRRALELCYWDDWPVQSIAKHLGVNRFTLARELRGFLGDMKTRLSKE